MAQHAAVLDLRVTDVTEVAREDLARSATDVGGDVFPACMQTCQCCCNSD